MKDTVWRNTNKYKHVLQCKIKNSKQIQKRCDMIWTTEMDGRSNEQAGNKSETLLNAEISEQMIWTRISNFVAQQVRKFQLEVSQGTSQAYDCADE